MPAKSSGMLSKLVCSILFSVIIDILVRLANRLKALSVSQYSSDEECDGSTARASSTSPKKPPTANGGSAFAEVVRATLKAKELERETAVAANKTV